MTEAKPNKKKKQNALTAVVAIKQMEGLATNYELKTEPFAELREKVAEEMESLPVDSTGIAERPITHFMLCQNTWIPVHSGVEKVLDEESEESWLEYQIILSDESTQSGIVKPYHWSRCSEEGEPYYHWLR